MKNNLQIIKENMKVRVNSSQFKLIVLFLICFNLYGTAYLSTNLSYLDGFINIMTNGYYVVMLSAIIFLNTINTYDKFENFQFFIIRFKNKSIYLKQLILNAIVSNLILCIVNLILLLIGLNLFASGSFVIKPILDYSILNIIYIAFYLIRFLIIIQLLTVLNICLLKIINNKLVVGLNIVIWLTILFVPYNPSINILSVEDMFLMLPDYFRLHYYANFPLEVFCSTIYILFLLILSIFSFTIAKNKMKIIGA